LCALKETVYYQVALTDDGSKPTVQAPPRWTTIIICLSVALAVWVVFGQTLHHEFINFDDNVYVYANSTVSQGLTSDGIKRAFTHRHGENWHPLTTLSHMLDCELYGVAPGRHHLTNVALHATTAILLFLLLQSLTGALWRSAFVAAVFAIHPLRVESVAWIAERKDVLSGLFFVLTLGAYVRYVRRLEVRRGASAAKPLSPVFHPLASGDYWRALMLFALGLLSKPMLVTLPFVLLLLDYWPLRRMQNAECRMQNHASGITRCPPRSTLHTLLRLLVEKLPFLALSAASCVATLLAQQNLIAGAQQMHLSLWWRTANACVAWVVYVRQMLYPSGLAAIYPHPGTQLSLWTAGMCVTILSLITAGVVWWRCKRPYLLVGWLWYLGMLVPVIGFVQVGNQAWADRYTYLPHLGLYIMVAWGAWDLGGVRRSRRIVLASAAGLSLTALLILAHVQTRYWHDSVLLWTHTLECTSKNCFAWNNLGAALSEQGKWSEAVPSFERALQINPDSAEVHNNLGTALLRQEKSDEAIQHYKRAVQLQPDYVTALCNLGFALGKQGRWNEAVPCFEQALRLYPDSAEAHNCLGVALSQQKRWSEAIAHFERALQINPAHAQARYNLILALGQQAK
jgi:protein O-mannosyl-transferase